MKHSLQKTMRTLQMGIVSALMLIVAPHALANSEEEDLYQEVEPGQWKTIGVGQMIDGWVLGNLISKNYQDYPIEVEIQQKVGSETVFRVWRPYKNLEETLQKAVDDGVLSSSDFEKIKKAQRSDYLGQIIIDSSNGNDYLIVGVPRTSAKPAGFFVDSSIKNLFSNELSFVSGNELYALNQLGYYMYNFGLPFQTSKSLANGYSSTYDEANRTFTFVKPRCADSSYGINSTVPSATTIIQWEEIADVQDPSNWIIKSAYNALDFTLDNAPYEVEYDWAKKCYCIMDFKPQSTLKATLKDGFNNYTIVSVTPDPHDKEINLNESSTSFEINQTDFPGIYTFNVDIKATKPLIDFLSIYNSQVHNNSALFKLTYTSLEIPKDAKFKAFYGVNPNNPSDFNVIAGESSANIPLFDLQKETSYTYYIYIAAYNIEDEEIARSEVIPIKFVTGKDVVVDPSVKSSEYIWDNLKYPENNNYSVAQYWFDLTPVMGVATPAYGNVWSCIAKEYKKDLNANGMKELNIIMSYMFSRYNNQYPYKYLYITKNYQDNDYSEGYTPILEDVIADPKYQKEEHIVNGKRYALELSSHGVNDVVSGSMNTKKHNLNHWVLDDDEIVYNVKVTLEFDPSDVNYDTPLYATFDYEETPKFGGQPAFIGSLTQTSYEYKTSPDEYGGWDTWVPFVSQGTSENPYPYTYTFKTNGEDTEYDFFVATECSIWTEYLFQGNWIRKPIYHMFESNNVDVFYPYWPDTSVGRKLLDPQNILDTRGETKAFTESQGPGKTPENYINPNFSKSIHLTGLEPNKVYTLKVDAPSYSTRERSLEIDGPLASTMIWISLMEYEPEIPVYQLVEHVGEVDDEGNQIYYTYDFYDTKKTYKVTLDSNDNVVSCSETSEVEESSDYKKQEYLFTDKLFIQSQHPVWWTDQVDAQITGLKGLLVHTLKDTSTKEYNVDTSISSDIEHLYQIIRMKNLAGPLDRQNFTLDNYIYSYANEYNYYGEREYPDSKVSITIGEDLLKENFLNGNVTTTGQLVVPTPMPDPTGVQYVLADDKDAATAEEDEGNIVYIRLYADDILENYGKNGKDTQNGTAEGVDFLEVGYRLPKGMKIHSHDYDVRFPYINPNVTNDLGDIMEDIESPSTIPNIRFKFDIDGQYDDKNGYVDVEPNNTNVPGFFNAHLGTIFDVTQNKGDESDVRSMELSHVPVDFPSAQIYDRWGEGMTAEVKLDLNAPEFANDVLEPVYDSENEYKATLQRAIRRTTPGGSEYEEVLYFTGLEIGNTPDGVTNDGDGNLTTGDGKADYTTLYLVEIPGGDSAEKICHLLTWEEIQGAWFELEVSEQKISYDDWWRNCYDTGNYLIKIEDGYTAQPFRIRNVYLFPVANEGFNNDSEINQAVDDVEQDKAPRRAAAEGDTEGGLPSESNPHAVIYHGVTTPPIEPIITYSEPLVTSADDMTVGSEMLARGGRGVIDVLVDGADVYNSAGVRVAIGMGRHEVTPGVYVVRKDTVAQKIAVR